MKLNFLLIIGVSILVLLSCEKDDNGTPDVTAYSISDIVGTWSGNAQSASNDFSLTITIDSEGNASGTGAQGDVNISDAEWNINDKGEVTGSNVISVVASGMLTVQWSNWSLQLNQDKNALTGEFSCNALGTMDVDLSKQ